jgi:hypothetical protein
MRYRGLVVATVILMLTAAFCAVQDARAALREEQVIYPSGSWQYANTGTRDSSVLPSSGWSSTDPLYPNLYWQRLSLSIPSGWSSKRVYVHVGACAFYVRAYLNGNYLGEHCGPATPFDADITPYINWSGANVLMLGVQDYSALLNLTDKSNNALSYDAAPDPSMQGPMPFAVWMYQPRLWTADIKLRAVPKVRVTDVFVRPSVRQWKLDVDLTLRNNDTVSHTVSIEDYVTKWQSPVVDKSFTPSDITIAAGATLTTTVSVPWTDPVLWSPNQPQLYTLTTTLTEDSVALDTLTTRFGFREFWIEKSADNTRSWFVLNGARQNLRGEGVWNATLGDSYVSTFIDWLRANNFNCVRMCSAGKESYYNIADEKGILVQSEVPFNFKQKYTYDATFWSRAQTYLTDQIKAWRNHPSIVFWGVENEVMLCSPAEVIGDNLLNLETAGIATDPTRVFMHEGDGDLRTTVKNTPSAGKNVQVVNTHNYDLAQPSRNVMYIMDFPNAAYVFGETTDATILPGYAFGTVLPDKSKPWYVGEFGAGCVLGNPQYLALHNGDDAYKDIFGQETGLMTAMGQNYVFQIDGYRYFDWVCGIAPWATYSGDPSIGDGPVIAAAFKPVTTRIKEYTHNLYAGDTITRTLTVYNDDVPTASNFNLHWRLVNGAQNLLSGDYNFVSQPGASYRQTLSFTAPATTSRLKVNLVLELRNNGVLVDVSAQAMSIFPARSNVTKPSGLSIYVYDPNYPSYSNIISVLNSLGVSYTRVYSLSPAGKPAGLYIIGHGSYASSMSSSDISAIQNWVRGGGTLLVNGDQWTAPQWLSWYGDASYGTTDYWYDYTIGFLRAPNHPILAGLQEDDCKWWGPDHYITHTVYTGGTWSKPSAGLMNILVDTGGRNQGLGDAPLVEYPDGRGCTIVNRMRIFDNTSTLKEPVARLLLQNIINYANTVRQRVAPKGLGVMAGTGSATPTVLTRMKLTYTSLSGLLSTYSAASLTSAFSTIIIDNDASVWTEVDANRGMLQSFVNSGGKIILRKITSARVAQANALTGVSMTTKATQLQHPQLEKKTADPVMDGISNDDVWWVYTSDEGSDWYRHQKWASAIVTDVISIAESATVKGLLIEPDRTGVLQSDSGQSYAIGAAERNAAVSISQPGYGLVRINAASGTGYYLVDQLLWDATMSTQLNQKAQRYLATLLTHCLETFPPQALQVTPGDGLASSGVRGGPFFPCSKVYTLTNAGGQPMNWTATKNQTWISLSSTSGTLAAGASIDVTVSLAASANDLLSSTAPYIGTVQFTNTSNGAGDTTRPVSLSVLSSVVGTANKSVMDPIIASVTASYDFVLSGVVSERTAYGFKIDDGSGVAVTVDAPGNTVSNGSFVSVKGTLNPVSRALASQEITVVDN